MTTESGRTPATPATGPDAWRRTLEAKHRFLETRDPHRPPPAAAAVRPEILRSWSSSLLSGVDATDTGIPRDERPDSPDRLLQAAQPVIDRLAGELAGTHAWAFLADRDCRLVSRVAGDSALARQLDERGAVPGALFGEDMVGTNGLGTAVEQQRPFIVAGSEHFREYENNVTTAGAPLRDPATRRLVGLLNVNCRYEYTNGLLLPFVTELTESIGRRLRLSWSADERKLFEEFMGASRRSGQAVVGVSQDIFVANAAARQLLDPADHELLRHRVCDAVPAAREGTIELRLGDEAGVVARCRPVAQARGRPAAVAVLTPSAATGAPGRPARRAPRSSPWGRLLDQLARVRADRLPLLLRGERGTGKTVLARSLHREEETGGPCVVLDAATGGELSRDWLGRLTTALADPAATVVLRYLDELAPSLCAPTAALLESARARLAATAGERIDERGALAAVTERFPATLDVPPLRERPADVAPLVTELIAELRPTRPRPRCTPDALAVLLRHPWPGNVRELRQVVATALVRSMSCDITVDDLPLADARGVAYGGTRLERVEREALVTALRDAGWNKAVAARELGISRATIYRKIRAFGIHRPAGRNAGPDGGE